MDYSKFGVKVANFKCFGDEPQGFHTLKPLNVIIGRNNSGKSSLLDMFPYFIKAEYSPPEILWHNGHAPVFVGRTTLTYDGVTKCIPAGMKGNDLPGGSDLDFAAKYIGADI